MAITRTFNSSTTSNQYTLYLSVTENSTSAANNTSSVSWRLYLKSGSWNFLQYRVGWSVSLNGTVVSSQSKAGASQVGIAKNGELTIKSGTCNIAHNTDGSLTMSIAASIDMDHVSYTPGPMSLSGSMTLTTIPRKSTLTISNGTLGVEQTIKITRASTSFTHSMTYVCGSRSGSFGMSSFTGDGNVLTRTWTPSLAWADQNTTGSTISVQITLNTISNGTTIGTDVKTITLTIPSSLKPTCSASVELVNSNSTIAGWETSGVANTVAVKGYTKYKITTSFTGAGGSTLKYRSVDVSATGEILSASPATSGILLSTTRTVKVRVTDSRGRESSAVTVNGPVIYDYSNPSIKSAVAYRCDANGNADPSGTRLYALASGTISSIGGHNVKKLQCRRRTTGSSSWTSWLTLTDGTGRNINAGLSTTSSYEVQFRISDSLGNESYTIVTVPTDDVTFNLRQGGKGAAFGKYAEKDNALQVGWDLELDNPLGVAYGGTGQTSVYTLSSDFTYNSSYCSDSSYKGLSVRYYPYSHMCLLEGSIKVTDNMASGHWITLATIPSGYRPIGGVCALSGCAGVNATNYGQARVINGSVQWCLSTSITASSDSPAYLHVSGVWYVN